MPHGAAADAAARRTTRRQATAVPGNESMFVSEVAWGEPARELFFGDGTPRSRPRLSARDFPPTGVAAHANSKMAAVSSFFSTRRPRGGPRRRRSSCRRRAIRTCCRRTLRVRDDEPTHPREWRGAGRSASRRRARTCGTARRRARRSRCARRRAPRPRGAGPAPPPRTSRAGPPSARLPVAQIARGAAEPPTALPLLPQLDLVATAFVPDAVPTGEAAARSTLPVHARAWSPSRTLAGDELTRRCCGARSPLAVAQPLRLAEAAPVHVVGAAVGGRAQPRSRPPSRALPRAIRRNSAQPGAIRRNSLTAPPSPQTIAFKLTPLYALRVVPSALSEVSFSPPRAARERLPHYGTDPQAPPARRRRPGRSRCRWSAWVAGTADAPRRSRGPPPRASLRCAIRGVR